MLTTVRGGDQVHAVASRSFKTVKEAEHYSWSQTTTGSFHVIMKVDVQKSFGGTSEVSGVAVMECYSDSVLSKVKGGGVF
ncbi:hypothetical protein CL629_02330 [bacterium]|nr:hypothetical protein [bacterium]|tara:strand:- start:1235 stop:1474 length:240 start_codon:yes stop_codon:yes gene_type:complete